MQLELDNQVDGFAADADLLRRLAEQVEADELGVDVEVSLLLVDDETIAALNLEWLGHEGPTDVISFPQWELVPGERNAALPAGALLGDIVISVDTAAAQAAEFEGWTQAHEVALLCVHGLLHLCGYDDQTPAARAAMQAREDQVLTAVGLPPAPRNEG